MSKRLWTRPELYLLHRVFGSTPTYLIAARLGRSYSSVAQQANLRGLLKEATYMAGPMSGRLRPGARIGGSTRFPNGNVPHNAGLKGWDAGGRSSSTRFKPGSTPPTIVQIGTVRLRRDGWDRKVSATGIKHVDWRPVRELVWTAHHGQIQAGQMVAFRAGQQTTVLEEITIDRLELVNRSELMSRNSYHNKYPKEIGRLIQLRGALNRQIRNRERNEESNKRSA